ncbi:unnamed protein product [Microthlaspi erraticum]|uniref:Alanyl-tRNA synthetase class IIc N-terminal domain-containing protein n=1 Tax=Microthlaspi erraticum TaxID=1685480 RepID=A0A6D2I4D4_9BRAS|nr:unnamed protein product [Microthlaspi erraticum]
MPGESKMIEWPAKRVRETFIDFFNRKSHKSWPSSSVVPDNDPTLFFANAGTKLFFFQNFDFFLTSISGGDVVWLTGGGDAAEARLEQEKPIWV